MIRRTALLLVLAVLGFGACTFERRPDLERRASVEDTLSPPTPSAPRAAVEDSVRTILAAFRDALRLGDAARVAQLSAPGADLVDQEEHVLWTRVRGEEGPLPGPLDGRRQGLGWVLDDSFFDFLGDGALVVNRYHATVSGEAVPWSATETFVFVRTSEGWRLRHLHRSRGLAEPLLERPEAPPSGP